LAVLLLVGGHRALAASLGVGEGVEELGALADGEIEVTTEKFGSEKARRQRNQRWRKTLRGGARWRAKKPIRIQRQPSGQ
jgi:hypothetical protein